MTNAADHIDPDVASGPGPLSLLLGLAQTAVQQRRNHAVPECRHQCFLVMLLIESKPLELLKLSIRRILKEELKKSKKLFLMRIQLQSVALMVLMLACGSALADENQRKAFRSACGPIPDPALLKSQRELNPWFDECAARIKTTALNQREDVFANSGASCTLQMKENGEIYNERIFRSSGSHAIDQAALCALRESAPFKDASDPLVYEKQILVEFRGDVSKSDAQVVTMKLISKFQPRAAAK